MEHEKNINFKKGVILNSSPREKGNSDFVSNEIFEKLKKDIDLEIIKIHKLKIFPCESCNYCYTTGVCKIEDDMVKIYPHFENDDIIFWVSPIYFYHLPGYSKIVIDRCQPYWVRKYVLKNFNLKKKFSSVVLIGATKGEQLFTGVNLTMKYFFDIINCEFSYETNLYIRNVDIKNEILYKKSLIDEYLNKLHNYF